MTDCIVDAIAKDGKRENLRALNSEASTLITDHRLLFTGLLARHDHPHDEIHEDAWHAAWNQRQQEGEAEPEGTDAEELG